MKTEQSFLDRWRRASIITIAKRTRIFNAAGAEEGSQVVSAQREPLDYTSIDNRALKGREELTVEDTRVVDQLLTVRALSACDCLCGEIQGFALRAHHLAFF